MSTTRFLNEDPWERVRLLKAKMPKTKFQMLLRGQNLVGYRHYADDVVEAFVEKSAEVGIDIFRVFDALNDERNFITAYKAIKKAGKHIQGTLSYALTERRMGGPIFTLDYYVSRAKKLEEMGADSFCIKDMAGIISPYDAYELISALKKALKIPVHLHTHYTSGMASMACLKAIEAGADGIDTCVAPFALRSSHPAASRSSSLSPARSRDTGLDLSKFPEINEYLESIVEKYIQFCRHDEVLRHRHRRAHAPDTGRHDKQPREPVETGEGAPPDQRGLRGDPKTRADMGYPSAGHPDEPDRGRSGRDERAHGQVQSDHKRGEGLLLRPLRPAPAPVIEEIRKKALKGYERGETPIDARPGDVIAPELQKAGRRLKGISDKMEDILIYALYPMTGMEFMKKKYDIE